MAPLTGPAEPRREPATGSDALGQLGPWLTRYVAGRIGDPAEAEDVAQEVLLVLAQSPPPRGHDLRAWAVGIARHKTADWWRAAGRREAAPVAHLPEHRDDAPGPAEVAERRDTVRRVRALLTRIPERDADLLLLRMSGCSGPEIAAALGMSHAAARVAQHRALNRLRKLLDEDPGVTP